MTYYIDDSNYIYVYLDKGVEFFDCEKTASTKEEVCNIIKNANYVPAIFDCCNDNINLVDPREFGITDKATCFAFDMYKFGTEDVINKIQKVANSLSEKNKDLSDYLNVVLKEATNKKSRNIDKILQNNIELKNAYLKEEKRAKKIGVINKNAILLSAMIKTGISE